MEIDKYDVAFRALELACETLKKANIDIDDEIDFRFLENKIHGTLIGHYLLRAEEEIREIFDKQK